MEINETLINHLSHLSKLEFNEQEKAAITADLQRILGFCEQLNELDTSGIEPLIYMMPGYQELRDDVPVISITHEEALKNAPLKDSDYFKVPKFIEK